MLDWQMNPHIGSNIIQSNYFSVYCIKHVTLTSLVERWRPETHTFHLIIGEMTITLKDIAMILGLLIHRLLITSTCDID